MTSLTLEARRIVSLLPDMARNLRLAAVLESVRGGLTTSQLFTLLLLDGALESGAPMSRLAKELGVSLPTATGLVDRLVREALVERRPHPEDRRVVLVRLTDAGRDVTRRILDALEDLVTRILVRMNEEERQALLQAVEQVHLLSAEIQREQRQMVPPPRGGGPL